MDGFAVDGAAGEEEGEARGGEIIWKKDRLGFRCTVEQKRGAVGGSVGS